MTAAGQSRTLSLLESITNVTAGFLISLLTGYFVFPLFSWTISFQQNVALTAIYTGISLIRGYAVRRVFNLWAGR